MTLTAALKYYTGLVVVWLVLRLMTEPHFLLTVLTVAVVFYGVVVAIVALMRLSEP